MEIVCTGKSSKAYSLSDDGIFSTDMPEGLEEGDTYFEGDVVALAPSILFYGAADNIIDNMNDALYNEVGEVANNNSIVLSQKDKDALDSYIRDFVDTHVKVNCYSVINVVEKVHKGEA